MDVHAGGQRASQGTLAPFRRSRRNTSMFSTRTVTTLACPEEGASVAFHQYTFRVGDKTILDGISGHFLAGRLTALMGPSGSGKTSLIETLTGSNLGGAKNAVTATKLTLNGKECTRDDIAAISGFVPQEDYFLPTMKVREAVEMSANLRLPIPFPGLIVSSASKKHSRCSISRNVQKV